MLKFKVKATYILGNRNEKRRNKEAFIKKEIARIAERYKNNKDTYIRIWRKKEIPVWESQENWIDNMAAKIWEMASNKYGTTPYDKNRNYNNLIIALTTKITTIEYSCGDKLREVKEKQRLLPAAARR